MKPMPLPQPWIELVTSVGPWPVDEEDPQIFGAAEINLHCTSPGSFELLDAWGFTYELAHDEEGKPIAAVIAEEPVYGRDLSDVWGVMARTFHTHGLWPVTTEATTVDAAASPCREPLASRSDLDVLAVLRRGAEVFMADNDPFMSLATAPTQLMSAEARPSARLYSAGSQPLVVTPVHRPADVPVALGWPGAINYDMDGHDISVVLGHWEEQFGAVLMHLEFDAMALQVARPPFEDPDLLQLAREHGWFCPDNLLQSGVESVSEYADTLCGQIGWYFWWD